MIFCSLVISVSFLTCRGGALRNPDQLRLVIYVHPLKDSFQSAVHRCVVEALTAAGHVVDDCDLYAEGFQPVLTSDERKVYHDVASNSVRGRPNETFAEPHHQVCSRNDLWFTLVA